MFSDSSRRFSISARNSSVSLWAISHFCSAVSFNVLSILLLRDFERFLPILPIPVRSWELWEGVVAAVPVEEPCWWVVAPSLCSTLLKYYASICVSAFCTSLFRLKEQRHSHTKFVFVNGQILHLYQNVRIFCEWKSLLSLCLSPLTSVRLDKEFRWSRSCLLTVHGPARAFLSKTRRQTDPQTYRVSSNNW